MELLNKFPDKSSNQIKQNNQAIHRWLNKYDLEWLRQHASKNADRPSRVDWEKRDVELLEKVKQVVKEMKQGKPKRITWSTVGNKLGIGGWFLRNKDKLPLTENYLDTKIESLKEYQLRKINWAFQELEKEGKEITKRNLIEKAGVKERYLEDLLGDLTI